MIECGADSELFEKLSRDLLAQGNCVRFQARGASMSPAIRDGEIVLVTPVIIEKLRGGDIVLTRSNFGFRVHRLVVADHGQNKFITRGDCGQQDDSPVTGDQILGIVAAKEVRIGRRIVRANFKSVSGSAMRCAARGLAVAAKLLRRAGVSALAAPGRNLFSWIFLIALSVLVAASSSQGQVAVDASTNSLSTSNGDLTGPGTVALTFSHTTTATANRLLLVGVAMDIAGSTGTTVSSVTYNGTALALLGAHNDSVPTRRVEMWSMLAPPNGTFNVVVSVNIPTAATVGVEAGATTFTGVDQSVPLGTFVSAAGLAGGCIASTNPTATCNSQMDVPSVVNGMVFDTLAVGLGTITVNGPQVSQWNVTSGGGTPTATLDLTSTGSARAGAPSVPISESFNEALNLTSAVANGVALNLTSVVPTTVALALTKANNAAGGNTQYTGTITGGGGNAFVGATVVVTGFTNANDNGTFVCTASSNGSITLNNPNGVNQTHAGTATVTTATVYNGTITGGAGNAFAGATVVISGFTNAANNGTFTASASTATALTLNNRNGIAEVNPGTASVATGAGGNTVYVGTITGGTANGFAGDTFTMSGFANGGNNGTFTCTASTATTLTCTNAAGVAETAAALATTNSTFNWSLGAVSINPTTADIAVTTSVATVLVGNSSTYNITITNSGPSAANTVSLTDTLAAGMALGTITPSPGVTCAGAGPITCTIGTLASGGTATVAITETAAASGAFANTATVTDSGTPPDPNTGNNSFTAVATVQSAACANVTQAAPGTNLTGILNTYYPGTASVLAGAKSIPVGAPTGAGAAIAAGNLLLVIQMQDASINDSNNGNYGNGSTGAGFTAINNAGNYEFVTATGAIAGGAVPIAGAGSGGGLVFAYNKAAVSANKGASSYQVILVPQYTTVSLAATGLTASPWNGSTGGVLALDASSTLNLSGATVSVNGLGFRGGAGLQLNGGVGGANTDYLFAAPATYTGVIKNGTGAPKGEGIAGTPFWIESGGTFANGNSSYPSGVAGTDGSSERGAPGNGGGGGTDAHPSGNDQNAGGGGGGNGGSGGFGGDSWNTNLSTGGEGGAVVPATVNRVALGGGGGAGTRNNSDGDTQASGGATGGGIIVMRANALAGTATLTANGSSSYNGTLNDAGGGGGAGGSIVVLSANGGEGGLTLQAQGGRGGDAWDIQAYSLGQRHGPGGGGGGGVVLVSGAPASISVAGGNSGTTLTPGVAYGATAGAAGIAVTNASLSQTSGTQAGAQCTPDMTLGKSHVGNFTRGLTATYTVPVSNLSPFGPSSGTVTVNDTLPVGLTPTSASGIGWSCSVAAQTVSCARGDALAASSSYPSITITANVAQTAPSTVTNTAIVAGGSELNLANDTATDVATVVSSADLSVTDAASPNPVAAGANITYAQVVTDSGPSAADNPTLVEAIPANTTFVSMTPPAGWNCITPGVGSTGNVVCSIVTLNGGATANFSMVVKVNAGVANGTAISNTVTANSASSDPNSANNSATAVTIVGATVVADLSVTNTASPNPVLAGSNITYTQVVTNTGSAGATAATFAEATPLNTTFVSIVKPAGWTCTSPPVSCTNPNVGAGSTGTFTVVYTVTAGTASGTVITDTATANATNDAFSGDNSATATDIVAGAGQADLALSTAATPPLVLAGNNITYTQTVTNNGPAAATNASFTEAIPANTTFVSVSAPAGWTCTVTASVTCTNPTLAAGSSADIIVVVNLAPTVAVATITANSSVSATTIDPTAANNSTTVVTNVQDSCDLMVTNTGVPSPVAAGGTITYTQTVTNGGPSNCTTATFTEPTPANTTFVSVAVVTSGGGTWTCNVTAPVSCANPSVPPGSTGTITAKFQVLAGTASGTIITDTATAASATHDTNALDNSATSTIAVAGAAQADLSVTNSASPNPVTAGNNITYTQTVTNGGPASATTISLGETIPANTTVVSLTGPAGWTCVTGVPACTIATLAANATATFTYVLKVNAGVVSGSTITETANVSSAVTSDPNNANNSASAAVQVGDSADLSVTNSPGPVPVQAANNITYTQVVANAGPSAATAVTLTEVTPASTVAQSLSGPAGWTCVLGTLTCTNPSLAAGTNATITFVVTVNAGTAAGTAINDTATVTSSISDPNAANNSATAADVVALGTQADLIATNSAVPASVAPGGNVTYTQTVTNNGPAAATAVTFTQTTPPNTTFQSITPPAGWTCGTQPPVGGTGAITCTDGSNLAVNGNASFTLVLQVTSATPSGTFIAETDTAGAGNIVPTLTTNSATATVIVANANSADMAIVKTAVPNPVSEGDALTYTLTVTNNGPATATTVTVTDPLPNAVTYLSSSTTQGTCSEAGGTVTCQLGSMISGATATVTIITLAGSPSPASNTASVTADQTDPNLANNSSTQTETITAPTQVQLMSFFARTSIDNAGTSRVMLFWKTGGEANNLGFNIYSEQNGTRMRLNPSLIAGSALLMRGALPKHSGKTYSWMDASSTAGSGQYWLEDVDVNGSRTMHGPISTEAGTSTPAATAAPEASALMLDQLNQEIPVISSETSHPLETVSPATPPTAAQQQKQFDLAAHSAVKIMVKHEGWYSVSQPDLVKAGLDASVDPSLLHLYAEANEIPIQITGGSAGTGGFGPQATINFYGVGIDTPYSGTRAYWLAAEGTPGLRIQQLPASSGSNQPPPNFPFTVEWKPRTTYFAALLTRNGNNFFGPLVSTTPVDQAMQVSHLDKTSTDPAQLEVVLQGVILGVPHDVIVTLNGTTVGNVTFTGQAQGQLTVNLPPGVLVPGNNTLTLTSQNGTYDTSLVDTVRIVYPHAFIADSDQLKFTGRAGDELKVAGFQSAPTAVLDITNPDRPVVLTPQVSSENGKYTLGVQVPWTSSGTATAAQHTLVALADDRAAAPAGIRTHYPSHWHSAQAGSEIVMVTHEDFAGSLPPLVQAHQAEGKSVAVIPVNDLYDEFTFGEHSPYAIRGFLQMATQAWHTVPKYLLLNGRASLDPRNYLGFGHLDFVPTKIVSTPSLMTASDDWFSDFTNTGLPTIATGRLPVATADEATTVAAKIAAYEGQSTNGPWTLQALMVADRDDTESFSQDSQMIQSQLPVALQVTDVYSSTMTTEAARQDIVTAINAGQLLVNYLGHGSEEQWSGDDIFDSTTVASLTNGSQLPVFLVLNCLNGFFQDVYSEPLAVTLELAPNGGAVAVLASSGLNQPHPQVMLDKMVVQNLFSPVQPTLGVAVLRAKSQLADPAVRATYVLLGDPAMVLKSPAGNTAGAGATH